MRDFEVYPPFRDELPLDLYGPPHLNTECRPSDPAAEFIRIAKNQQKIFGIVSPISRELSALFGA